MITTIHDCNIENNGDVDHGLDYLRHHWSDSYVLDAFENAKTSADRKADLKVPGQNGMYVLKHLGNHHYSLEWRKY